MAITTVGFGDVTPTTDALKLFTIFYILVGIALLATYLNLHLKHRTLRRQQKS